MKVRVTFNLTDEERQGIALWTVRASGRALPNSAELDQLLRDGPRASRLECQEFLTVGGYSRVIEATVIRRQGLKGVRR